METLEGLTNVRFEHGDAQVCRFTPAPPPPSTWRSHRGMIRLLRDADPSTVARVGEAVQAALEPCVTPDGLLLGSPAWLVTADRPWP